MEANTIPCTPNGQTQYIIIKDGNGQEHKVVNFNNPEMVLNKGIINIEIIRKSQTRHRPSSNFRCYRDPLTEIIYGINLGLNRQKDILFQGLVFNDFKQYNLAIPQDRKEWAVMQFHPGLVGSINAQGKPSYKKIDVEAESVNKIKKIGARKAAYATIEGLSHMQMIDMARNCGGIDTKNSSMQVIQAQLYDFADTKPDDFNRIWTMTNREALTVFKRCLLTGLVHFDVSNGFLWKKATPLGNSEPVAVDFITKNHSLLMSMDTESKLLDSEFEMKATQEEKEAFITNQPIFDKGVSNEAMKYQQSVENKLIARDKEMEEMKAQLKQLLANKSSNVVVPETFETETKAEAPVVTAEQTELRELQVKAHKLGMKHAYVTKDKEKIHLWLKEKEGVVQE